MDTVETVKHPPELWPCVTEKDETFKALSVKKLDDNFYAVLAQSDTLGYVQGTVEIAELADGDVFTAHKLEGENKIPVASK